jgi:hypothetical protein
VPRTRAPGRVLSARELNRATLARQHLLTPAAAASPSDVLDLVARLVGLQAQQARPPFVGLWTRAPTLSRHTVADAITARRLVKATFVRGTLHLLTAADYLTFRATLQPVLTSASEAIQKERGEQLDVPRLVAAARAALEVSPRSFAELTSTLTRLFPDSDPGSMRYAVRTHLPLIQVPTAGPWVYPGNPRFALADEWLATPLPDADHTSELARRYLAAFGPATARDAQTWSYLPGLAAALERLRPDLVTYADERGRELFDLPDLPRAAAGPAPVRFLPEFDNLLLAHQDRGRFVPPPARKQVYLPGLRVAATVLLDGMVGGTWTTTRVKRAATLYIALFAAPDPATRAELEAEGERLVRFAEPDAESFTVRVSD